MPGERKPELILLEQIRDLLVPIADHYRDEFEERQAAREAERRVRITSLLGNPKRRAAWDLADGSVSQREISKRAGLDEGATSRLFKSLRELGAVAGDLPRRTMEV